MRIVFLAKHLSISFVIIIIVLLFFYFTEISVSALSPSYTTPSLSYGIKDLAFLSSRDDSSSDAVSANTTMTLLPDSSTIIYETEAFVAPPTVKTFVIYMANEFHENWPEESHKLLTNKNAYTIPTNLTVSNGTNIAFRMADAPWDTPHAYIVRVIDVNTNETALQTPLLSYPKLNRSSSNSEIMVLPIGEYRVEAYLQGTDKVETKPISIKVIDTPVNHSSNITAGFFYSPQSQVVNPYDNDGHLHPAHFMIKRKAQYV